MKIDLNADVGEGNDDTLLIPLLSSVNIACGAHAGDDQTIYRAVALAGEHGIGIGAHPSYPDRENFGRIPMPIPPLELERTVTRQIERVWQAARRRGLPLRHVKPHGALYHAASEFPDTALAVIQALKAVDPTLILVGPPRSLLLALGAASGLKVAAEAFADRRYLPDGKLVGRDRPEALVGSEEEAAVQAVSIARDQRVTALDGSVLSLHAQTLCLHGDTPNAVSFAQAIRKALTEAGVRVAPLETERFYRSPA